VSDNAFAEALARAPLDQYVLWTGSPPTTRGASTVAHAVSCLREVWAPVGLRTLLQRASRIAGGGHGAQPDAVRNAVRQHQFAHGSVMLLLRKRADGEYVAVTDIPFAADLKGPVRAGDVLVDRRGELAWPLAPEAGHAPVG
jgi:hypothetical protein